MARTNRSFSGYDAKEVARENPDVRIVESTLISKGNTQRPRAAWHGTAFVLEVVVLLLFIAVSMSVVCSMFGKAYEINQRSDTLTRAMMLASTGAVNCAETFEADPTDSSCPQQAIYSFDGSTFHQETTYMSGMYVVTRTVQPDKTSAGTLYRARIDVSLYNENVCSLTVAVYASDNGSTSTASTNVASSGKGKQGVSK